MTTKIAVACREFESRFVESTFLNHHFKNYELIDIKPIIDTSTLNKIKSIGYLLCDVEFVKSIPENISISDFVQPSNIICLSNAKCSQCIKLEKGGASMIYRPFESSAILDLAYKLTSSESQNSKSKKVEITDKHLVFSSSDRYVMIDRKNLMLASSSGNYTTLVLDSGKKVTVTKQIGQISKELPEHEFFRIHHGHIINRNFIQTILKQGQLVVVLADKITVPVSRRKKAEFLDWLGVT